METIFRTPADAHWGTIAGVPVRLTGSVLPPTAIAAEIQAILDAALGAYVFLARWTGARLAINRLDGSAFSWALSEGARLYLDRTTSSGTGTSLYSGLHTIDWVPSHGARVSPPRRAWTRLKASDPGHGLIATVLDTQTYFDLRFWARVTEQEQVAGLLNRPFVVGSAATPWTELDTTGHLVLRVTDARGLAQPRLVGSNASMVEYNLETVLVKP